MNKYVNIFNIKRTLISLFSLGHPSPRPFGIFNPPNTPSECGFQFSAWPLLGAIIIGISNSIQRFFCGLHLHDNKEFLPHAGHLNQRQVEKNTCVVHLPKCGSCFYLVIVPSSSRSARYILTWFWQIGGHMKWIYDFSVVPPSPHPPDYPGPGHVCVLQGASLSDSPSQSSDVTWGGFHWFFCHNRVKIRKESNKSREME